LGYSVAIARSGAEAIEKVRYLTPSIVFLNPILPVLPGWDALTLLKSDPATCHIPVIIMATPVERNQSRCQEADGFLTLPITTPTLQNCLVNLNQSSFPVSEQIQQEQIQQEQTDRANLTVLHLYIGATNNSSPDAIAEGHQLVAYLNNSFYPNHCRVLEVDDLDQADLIARVWNPSVVLIDGWIPNPLEYLEQFSQYEALAALPLVTLTREITQAANQISGLNVFPCLDPWFTQETYPTGQNAASSLLQVIQIAADTVTPLS
jgi:CheY-like chemotaxis protein